MKRIVMSLIMVAAYLIPTLGATPTDFEKDVCIFFLRTIATVSNQELPSKTDEYIIDAIKLEEDCLITEYTLLDDQTYKKLKSTAKEIKKTSLTSYRENLDQHSLLLSLCLECGRNIVTRYYNNAHSSSFDVQISSEEIEKILGTSVISPEYKRTVIDSYLSRSSQAPYSLDESAYSYLVPLETSISEAPKEFKFDNDYFIEIISGYFTDISAGSVYPAIALYLGLGLNETLVDPYGESRQMNITNQELVGIFRKAIPSNSLKGSFGQNNTTQSNNLKGSFGSGDSSSDEEDKSDTIRELDVKPTFMGGDTSRFSQWVSSQLKYPSNERKYGFEGCVKIKFTIDTNGKLTDISVIESAGPGFDKEALRVVRKSPKWTPGLIDGKPVRVTYTFPVIFQLR